MTNNLKSLYINYRDKPTERLNGFITDVNQWIKVEHQHPEEAEQLTRDLYATLNICYQALSKLNELPWFLQSLITTLITIEQFMDPLHRLITSTKTTMLREIPIALANDDDDEPIHQDLLTHNTDEEDDVFEDCLEETQTEDDEPMPEANEGDLSIDHDLSAHNTDEEDEEDELFVDCIEDQQVDECIQEEPLPALVSIDDYYDRLALNILNQNEQTLSEKILRIKMTLDSADQNIQLLVTQKNQISAHENELEIIQSDLVQQNEAQEASRRIPVSLYNTGSYIGSVVSGIVKTTTPIIIQQQIDAFIPKKPLSLKMRRMQTLIGTITDLGEIQKTEFEINHTIQELAGNDAPLRQLFVKATIEDLSELSKRIRISSELMGTMAELIDNIKINQINYEQARRINSRIDGFILDYDGFLVKLSLLLSHYIHNFFKTETASKIESARSIKTELIDMEKNYQANVDENKLTIQNSPVLSAPTKEAIETKLNIQPILPEEEIASDVATSVGSQFNSIYTLFQPLKIHHDRMIESRIFNERNNP